MLYSNIKNILQNINHEYKIKINKDLENIGILIEEKEKDILKEITFIQRQQTNLIFSKINEYYNDLDLSYNKYNNNNILKIDNKINEYIESFFIHITDELKNITKTFNDEEKKGKINLEEILTINDNYLSNLSLIEINNSDIKKRTSQIHNNLTLLMDNLEKDIINQFNDFPDLLKTKTRDIIFEGFNSKNDLRNLEEYSLSEIEDINKEIENIYNQFKEKILKDYKFSSLNIQKNKLITSLSNQVLLLSNDFYSYKEVFKQYINESKINDYFNELENEIMKIKNNITEYNLEISNIIDKIKNAVISYLSNSNNKIKKEINEIIYQTLDIIYEEKFENLTESNFSQIINEKIVNLPTIQILDNNKEIINIIE